jgi:hypothetical protein
MVLVDILMQPLPFSLLLVLLQQHLLIVLLNWSLRLLRLLLTDGNLLHRFCILECVFILLQDHVPDFAWRPEEVTSVGFWQLVLTTFFDVAAKHLGVVFENLFESLLVKFSNVSELNLEIEQQVVNDLGSCHQLVLEMSEFLAKPRLPTVHPLDLEQPQIPDDFCVHLTVLQLLFDELEIPFLQSWPVVINEMVVGQRQVGHRGNHALIQLVILIFTGAGYLILDLAG